MGEVEVVRWHELVRRAGTPRRARTWLADGAWWRVLGDCYAPAEVPDGLEARAAAVALVLPDDVALSHRTALWLLGLDLEPDQLDATVPRGRHLLDRPGVRVHSAALPADELCLVAGRLVVTAARGVLDVARREPLAEGVALADAALRAGLTTVPALEEAFDAARGLRGVRAARLVLPHVEPRSESLMESRLRVRLVLGGVPRPRAQVDLYGPGGHVARADLWLEGVVIEFDGREARLDPGVFVRERRRQTAIAELGCELRRFTAPDVYRRPAAEVCSEVLRAVRQASGRARPLLRLGPDTLRPPRLRPPPTVAQQQAPRSAA